MSEPAVTPRYLTRRNVGLAIVVLTVLMVLLLIALLRMLASDAMPSSETTGIRSLQVIYGPGVGREPFFDSPMGVAYAPNGHIYVADTGNSRVVVFDQDGRFQFEFGGLGVAKPAKDGAKSWEPGLMNYPTDVAVADDGTVYVADFRNDQIQVFDANGNFVKAFPDRDKRVGKGASGQGGEGVAASSIAVAGDRVWVTDAYQVLVFDRNGTLLDQFGRPGAGPMQFDHPNGIAVAENQMYVISDSNNNRVVAIAPGGEQLWSVGEPYGASTTQAPTSAIDIPRGLTRRDDGTFMVTDAAASRLVRIDPNGEVVADYGQYGTLPGELDFPVDVDAREERLVIAEKGGDRVQVVVLEP